MEEKDTGRFTQSYGYVGREQGQWRKKQRSSISETGETLSRTDGHWLARLVCEIWPRDSAAVPLNTPAVMCVHWMAPFKCMRPPLKASIKKIKGDCSFIFIFFFNFKRFCPSNISSAAQGEKGNSKLLLSLKLQGVSFIVGVQRQLKMCVAAFSHYLSLTACLSSTYTNWQLHGIIGNVTTTCNLVPGGLVYMDMCLVADLLSCSQWA